MLLTQNLGTNTPIVIKTRISYIYRSIRKILAINQFTIKDNSLECASYTFTKAIFNILTQVLRSTYIRIYNWAL
jgi:hypothetical protein